VIKSLRLRLTLWYLAFFSLLMLLFSMFLYSLLSQSIRSRLDERLSSEVNPAASLFQAEIQELNGDVPKAAAETVDEMRPRGILLAAFEDRRLLAASAPARLDALDAVIAQALGGAGAELAADIPRLGKSGSRAATHRFRYGGRSFVTVAVAPLDSVAADLQRLRRTLYLSLGLLLLIAGAGGFALATRSMAPLGWMAGQAREITGSSLHRRLEIGSAAEELTLLAASFNDLLSRLDQSFETMRRFVADASHELRTPLAVIHGEADVALAKDRTASEYRDSLAVILDESRRLSRLVDDLLNLARADAGRVKLNTGELYLDDLAAECCRSISPLAAARGLAIDCRCPEDVSFHGDEELLRRMILNLLDNAVRYTPPGGKISVLLETENPGLRLSVSDTGTGIPPEAAPHVFERFYRADKARSRHEGGFGLGLSIVKWIAEAHNGSVKLTANPGAGSTFVVRLPR
jgi:two-component system OmpR family sensor kinase